MAPARPAPARQVQQLSKYLLIMISYTYIVCDTRTHLALVAQLVARRVFERPVVRRHAPPLFSCSADVFVIVLLTAPIC